MTNALTLQNNNSNPFEQVAQKEVSGAILKFSKGDWEANGNLMNGAVLTANVIDLCHGWRKWVNAKIVDSDIGFVRNNFVPKQRNDLDAFDENEWPVGQDGKRSDPWVWGYYLRLEDENGAAYIWTASSVGARGAIGDLSKKFARKRANPIIKLGSGSYKHATYGKVLIPALDVVGWDEVDGGAPALPAPAAPSHRGFVPAAEVVSLIDDSEIPF
jgi:hypothetical protein